MNSRVIVTVLGVLLFPSLSFDQGTVKLKEATIAGHVIRLGQGADIVQSRIKADRFVTSDYNYGDISKGYYTDKGITYVITYGPPRSGSGGYLVTQIEKVGKQGRPPAATATGEPPPPTTLTRQQVIEARRKYKVQVVSFDASQSFGTEFPYSDFVRLKITNGSGLVLPTLTVLAKRFDRNGRMIGSSRAPAIAVADLKPGQTAEVDYYPRGHLPGVKKITVEIEALIAPDVAQFFEELPAKR